MGYKPALRDINTILWTEKTKFVRGLSSDDFEILSFHGSTGNGKSMISSLKFMSRIYNSGVDEQNFILAGRDITALERRFIQSNHSVFNWYPFRGKWKYNKVGVGGSRMIIRTRTGEKYVYLTPFNNVAAYTRILGDTIHGVFVDEAVEADEMFMQEIVGRVTRTKGTWMINTSNGGDPNHYFYTHILNRSVLIDDLIEVEHPTPEGEKRYRDEVVKDNWLYVHMRLEDNPSYTEDQLASFYELYPSGSFMYYSRVLGIRGFSQDSPFAPYMTESVYIKKEDLEKEGFYPARIVFSVDSGGHVFSRKDFRPFTNDIFGEWYSEYEDGDYGTKKGGHTVMLSGGFTSNNKKFVLLDTYFPNHMHSNVNVDRMLERIYNIGSKFPLVRRPYMFVDNADTTMLAMLRDKKGNSVQSVRPAVKRDNSIQLDEPLIISLMQQYMMRGNFRVLDTPTNRKFFVPAMIQATLESDGKLSDNRDWEADIQDDARYIFSSMYRALV